MLKFKKLKVKDNVKVITGKDVGKTGEVLKIDREKGRVLIAGLNLVKKTMKKSNQNPNGGIKDIEAPLDISNVMLICPKCKKPTRIAYVLNTETNKKIRTCKRCKEAID